MASFDTENLLLACAAFIVISEENNKKRPRRHPRYWQRSFLQARKNYSGSHLLTDLKVDDAAGFKIFCRMSVTDFEYLLNLVGPKIAKRNTNYRDAIPLHERLAVTLRFLATGDSYTSLMYVSI